MKKKLSLKELEIKSFITELSSSEAIKSGIVLSYLQMLCYNFTEEEATCPPTYEVPKDTRRCNNDTTSVIGCNDDSIIYSCNPRECLI